MDVFKRINVCTVTWDIYSHGSLTLYSLTFFLCIVCLLCLPGPCVSNTNHCAQGLCGWKASGEWKPYLHNLGTGTFYPLLLHISCQTFFWRHVPDRLGSVIVLVLQSFSCRPHAHLQWGVDVSLVQFITDMRVCVCVCGLLSNDCRLQWFILICQEHKVNRMSDKRNVAIMDWKIMSLNYEGLRCESDGPFRFTTVSSSHILMFLDYTVPLLLNNDFVLNCTLKWMEIILCWKLYFEFEMKWYFVWNCTFYFVLCLVV